GEALAGDGVDLLLEAGELLGEVSGQAREDGAVDGDAAALHARQRRHHRPLQRLVDARAALRDEARLQREPQAQGDVRILGGIGGRLVDRYLVEGDLRLAGAGDLREG